MRIAVVCPYDLGSHGGVQSVTRDLVTRLRAEGDDAFLVGPGARESDGVDVGRSRTVPGNGANSPIAINPAAVGRVRRALVDADIVHVHEPMMPFVSVAALTTPKPTVATFHAGIAPWTARLYRTLEGFGEGLLCDASLTAVSPTAMSGLPDSWAPITIVPNAIDVASFRLDVARVPGRVVVVGRDDPRKGLDVILSAWPTIKRDHPGAELHVIGPEREEAPGVVWHGRVRDREKRELMASSSLYVAPHLGGESFGIVLAEAMAAGCAVVASDLPAFRPVGGGAATFFEPGDTEALASAATSILSDDNRTRELTSIGSTLVSQFDWSVVVARYRAIYERVANVHK